MKATVEYLPDQPGDMKQTLADVTLAARALGYAPKVSIGDGHPPLRRLVAHRRRHLSLLNYQVADKRSSGRSFAPVLLLAGVPGGIDWPGLDEGVPRRRRRRVRSNPPCGVNTEFQLDRSVDCRRSTLTCQLEIAAVVLLRTMMSPQYSVADWLLRLNVALTGDVMQVASPLPPGCCTRTRSRWFAADTAVGIWMPLKSVNVWPTRSAASLKLIAPAIAGGFMSSSSVKRLALRSSSPPR